MNPERNPRQRPAVVQGRRQPAAPGPGSGPGSQAESKKRADPAEIEKFWNAALNIAISRLFNRAENDLKTLAQIFEKFDPPKAALFEQLKNALELREDISYSQKIAKNQISKILKILIIAGI